MLRIFNRAFGFLNPRFSTKEVLGFQIERKGLDSFVFGLEIREDSSGRYVVMMKFNVPDAHNDACLSIDEFNQVLSGIVNIGEKIKDTPATKFMD